MNLIDQMSDPVTHSVCCDPHFPLFSASDSGHPRNEIVQMGAESLNSSDVMVPDVSERLDPEKRGELSDPRIDCDNSAMVLGLCHSNLEGNTKKPLSPETHQTTVSEIFGKRFGELHFPGNRVIDSDSGFDGSLRNEAGLLSVFFRFEPQTEGNSRLLRFQLACRRSTAGVTNCDFFDLKWNFITEVGEIGHDQFRDLHPLRSSAFNRVQMFDCSVINQSLHSHPSAEQIPLFRCRKDPDLS